MLEEDLQYPRASWAPDSRNWPQHRGEVVRLLLHHGFQDRRSECSLLRRGLQVVVGAQQLLLVERVAKELESQYEVYSYSGLGYNCTVRCKSSWTVCSDNCNTILGGTCTLFALVEVRFFEGGEDCFLTVLADFFSELLLTYERRINRLTSFGLVVTYNCFRSGKRT